MRVTKWSRKWIHTSKLVKLLTLIPSLEQLYDHVAAPEQSGGKVRMYR